MALSFGRSNEEDVVSLIAAKKYARAIEILKARLQKRGPNPSLRMQLADVLILADKKQEAVSLLLPLADQYAREGFAAKAVSVLKKIQKVDPGRRDVEERLARQIEERQREAVRPRSTTTTLGAEEAPAAPEEGEPDGGPSFEIGFVMAPVSTPAEPTVRFEAPVVERAPLPPRAAPPPSSPDATLPTSPDATLPESSPLVAPLLSAEPLPALVEIPTPPLAGPPPAPAAAVPEMDIEDYDLLYAGSGDEAEEIEVPLEAIEEEPKAAAPMSATQFGDELMGLVDEVFKEFAAPAGSALVAPAVAPPSQIVVSPLFRDFSVDEMVAVIQGLRLLTFERGGVILREGSPGGSLYTLTSGRVRAFKRDPSTGRQSQLGDLAEGAFFGEMSILTGQPRMASIVALTRCELLELDRPTLDEITKTHPHVWNVLREFAEKREAGARRLGG